MAQGEEVIRKIKPDSAILRVPVLYGPCETLDESAVTVLAKLLAKKSASGDSTAAKVKVDHWAMR